MDKLILPDKQARQGVSLEYLTCIGNLILDRKPDVIIDLGDFGDMFFLNRWIKGTRAHALATLEDDLVAIKRGKENLEKPWIGHRTYSPKLHILEGNHDGCSRCEGTRMYRWFQREKEIKRGDFQEPLDVFRETGWKVHHFLRPVNIAGIIYSHFFPLKADGNASANSNCGCSSAASQLQAVSRSCTSGHKPGLDYAQHPTPMGVNHGLIAGSCYDHDENYRGNKLGNTHWHGVIYKHNVYRGEYDLELISLNEVKKRYG